MSKRLTAIQGDITRQPVDAIMNAANASLMGEYLAALNEAPA
jgi:O-acetyl-ADP-ribose deacetylase (regulator of RNase III)